MTGIYSPLPVDTIIKPIPYVRHWQEVWQLRTNEIATDICYSRLFIREYIIRIYHNCFQNHCHSLDCYNIVSLKIFNHNIVFLCRGLELFMATKISSTTLLGFFPSVSIYASLTPASQKYLRYLDIFCRLKITFFGRHTFTGSSFIAK